MKRHQRLMGIVALSGAAALVMSGCASGSNGDSGGKGSESTKVEQADYNPQPREKLKQGGDVTFAINEITPQMNPFHGDATADTNRLTSWYMPQVLLMTPEGKPKPNPAYLDDWESDTVDGNTVITMKVNKKATWNDGTPIDYTAFKTTWEANRGEGDYQPNATDGYKEIKSVEKGDSDKDVIVTFDGEFAWPQMVFLTGILHPDIDSAKTFNEGFIEDPHPEWGAGPYKVKDYDQNGQTMTFVPNDKWWGDKPLLDKVTFRGLDSSAAVNAFKNDEVDYVEANSKDRLEQVQDRDNTTVYRAQQTANTLIQLNADTDALSDIDVRKAFYMAVNVDQQKKIAWNGLDYSEDPAGSFTLYSFQPGYKNSLKEAGWEFDTDAANKLLDDAGWEKGDDGIREKDGEKLSVTYPIFNDSATQKALAKALQQEEKKVGIDLKIDVRSPQDFSTDLTTKNWDVVSLRFTASDPFGPAWFCQMYCSDSQLNLSGTGTDEIDDMIHEDLESITDADEQTKKAMELEPKIMAKTWGVFPLYNGPTIAAVTTGLANLTPEPFVGLDLFGIQPVEDVGWEQ